MANPRLIDLNNVIIELQRMATDRSAINPTLRKRLIQMCNLGGARPKATVQDELGQYWLVKPLVINDAANIPMLEHFAQSWGDRCGMRFAKTHYFDASEGHIAIRVLRFDRFKQKRTLCISAASLLQTEYPSSKHSLQLSKVGYPRLAAQLRLIGVPLLDTIELFNRMVFNAICGNYDDHLRNHAAVFDSVGNQ